MFSSKTDVWSTPQDFYDKYNTIYKFTLDPCSNGKNAKCNKYFTESQNGLKQDWGNNIVFMNPPYGRTIGLWIKKAYESSLNGATVVCLIPSRTDTRWWHEYVIPFAEVTFIKGRLKFGGSKTPAPFPSAVVIFNNK
jgi:DNA N-6-adenine-methyltransferase (Dam).